MTFEDAFYSSQRANFPVTTESTESFRNLMRSVTSSQRSAAGLQALGVKPSESAKPGILSRLFDQRKGIISAPLRAVTAFAADVAGMQTPELRRYNPLESAVRAAKGEFAVTGGDIFKVRKNDGFLERLGKYAGALAVDVGLDPLTYVGGVGVFNKARLAEMAINQSDQILSSTLSVVARRGGNVDDLVNNLFKRSRLFDVARAEEAAGIAGKADSALAQLGAESLEAVSDETKKRIAASQLGNLVGESLLTGGRVNLRKQLAKLVGSDDIAKELFEQLPREIAGGFFLKTPIAGKPIARIAGGKGTAVPGAEFLSKLRFAGSATGPARWFERYLDGKTGPMLSEVKRSLLVKAGEKAVSRTTMLDYVTYKNMLSGRNLDITRAGLKTNAVLSGVQARYLSLTEAERPQFTEALRKYFMNPASGPVEETLSAAERQGMEAASEVATLIREAYDEAVAAGIPITDLGEDYRMLMFTEAEKEIMAKESGRVMGRPRSVDYNPLLSRKTNLTYHPDPEVRAIIGSDIGPIEGGVYMSPSAANDVMEKKIGRRPFEEDPIVIAARYTEFASRAIAARRFVQTGLSTGTLMKFAPEAEQMLDETKAVALLSAVEATTPKMRQKAEQLRAGIRKRLENMVSPESLSKRQEQLRDEINGALKTYDDAAAEVKAASDALRNATDNRQRVFQAKRLASAQQARDTARDAYKAATRNTTLLQAQGIDVTTDTYLTVRRELAELEARLPLPKDQTDAQKLQLKTAEEAVKEARENLYKAVDYSSRRSSKSSADQYAKAIVDLAEELSADEVKAVTLLTSADSLDDIIIPLYGQDSTVMMNVVGDIQEVYAGVRKYMTTQDLDDLSAAQKAALGADRREVVSKYIPTEVIEGMSEADRIALGLDEVSLMRESSGKSMAAMSIEASGEPGYGVRKVGASDLGLESILPRDFADVYAPHGVADVLESYYVNSNNVSEWKKWLGDVYDPMFLVWKSSATVGRGPAYVMLNTVGGLANNFLARVSGKSHKQAAAIIAGADKITKDLMRKNPNASAVSLVEPMMRELQAKFGNVKVNGVSIIDLYATFLERGGHFTTDMFFQQQQLIEQGIQVAQPFRGSSGRMVTTSDIGTDAAGKSSAARLSEVFLNSRYMRTMSEMSQISETFIRFAAFIDGFGRYNNYDSAMNLSMMLHFDYSDLSDAEKSIRRLVPFYTFSRRNIPLQMRMMFMAPDQVGKIFKANANLEKAFGLDEEDSWLDEYLPDYIVDSGGFLLRFPFGGNFLGLFPKLPLNDLDRMVKTVDIAGIPLPLSADMDEIQNAFGPNVKIPIEVITNRNLRYGYEYESKGELAKEQAKNLLPQFQLSMNILSAAGVANKERQLSSLFQILIGAPYGMTTIGERQLRGGAYSRSLDLNKELRNAAEEAKVDTDWLRERLNDNTPIPVIAAMIGAGMADPDTIAAGKQRKPGRRNFVDYTSTLSSLQAGKNPFLD